MTRVATLEYAQAFRVCYRRARKAQKRIILDAFRKTPGYPCSKRLAPFMPEMLSNPQRDGHTCDGRF